MVVGGHRGEVQTTDKQDNTRTHGIASQQGDRAAVVRGAGGLVGWGQVVRASLRTGPRGRLSEGR